MADDPYGQHGSRAFRCIERESKNIDFPETIVTSWLYLVGRCRGIKQCIAKYLHVGKGDAKDRSKYMRFMLAFAMQGVKNVVLEFAAKIRSFTVR